MSTTLSHILQAPGFPADIWERQNVEPNDVLIRAGDSDHRVYLIEQGEFAVSSSVDLDGSRRVRPGISTLGPGQVVGEFCLFNTLPRTATVTATTAGQVIAIDAIALQAYLDQHPDIGYRVMKDLNQALVGHLYKSNKRFDHLYAWGLKAHNIDRHL